MLNFCYLGKIQLDKSLAPEDLHRDGKLALVIHNFLDGAFETVERAIGNLDGLAYGKRRNGLFVLICHRIDGAQNTGDFALAQGDGYTLDCLHHLELTAFDAFLFNRFGVF